MFKKLSKKKNLRGFTFIELSLVILLAVALVSIVIWGFQSSRAKGRDSRRVSDLADLRTALQLYYIDEGVYPEQEQWCSLERAETDTEVEEEFIPCSNFKTAMEPYLGQNIPGDPLYPKKEGAKIYSYRYKTILDGEEYKIHADLETKEPYEVYSGGGNIIVYMPPGEPPPEEVFPPTVLTLPLGSGGGGSDADSRILRGEIISPGSGRVTLERGFIWGTDQGGPYPNHWEEFCEATEEEDPGGSETPGGDSETPEPGPGSEPEEGCPLGIFEEVIGGFTVPPGTCINYYYKARARDIEGGWGVAENEISFPACPQ